MRAARRAFVEAIASVTAAPVRTLINTHHHGDHTWGNALFPTATIVAHDRTRAEMLAFGPARPRRVHTLPSPLFVIVWTA